MKYIDMHVHSTASDGTLLPSQLVDYAVKKELAGIAITDHDTVSGIEEAIIRSQAYEDFIVIPGIELSTSYDDEDVHILGYMIDYKNNNLLKLLKNFEEERNRRAIKMINKLKTIGIHIDLNDVNKFAAGKIIARPHIANALIERGYVKDIQEAFSKYLSKGRPAYVPRQKLTPVEAIDIIKNVGGICVVAHPGLLNSMDILYDLIRAGIDGIEVYHSDHTKDQSLAYLKLAQEYGLLITGGSDFHYPPNTEKYHGDLGSIKVPLENIMDILK